MKQRQAKDIMNPGLLVVREGMSVEDLAVFFTENEISGAPVIAHAGSLVGVVSLSDLARSVTASGNVAPDRSDPDYFVRGWEDRYNPEDLKQLRIVAEEVTVRDLMSTVVHCIAENTSVAECARRMLSGHLHRVLVTRGDRLLGIITTFDLLRLVAEVE